MSPCETCGSWGPGADHPPAEEFYCGCEHHRCDANAQARWDEDGCCESCGVDVDPWTIRALQAEALIDRLTKALLSISQHEECSDGMGHEACLAAAITRAREALTEPGARPLCGSVCYFGDGTEAGPCQLYAGHTGSHSAETEP